MCVNSCGSERLEVEDFHETVKTVVHVCVRHISKTHDKFLSAISVIKTRYIILSQMFFISRSFLFPGLSLSLFSLFRIDTPGHCHYCHSFHVAYFFTHSLAV